MSFSDCETMPEELFYILFYIFYINYFIYIIKYILYIYIWQCLGLWVLTGTCGI